MDFQLYWVVRSGKRPSSYVYRPILKGLADLYTPSSRSARAPGAPRNPKLVKVYSRKFADPYNHDSPSSGLSGRLAVLKAGRTGSCTAGLGWLPKNIAPTFQVSTPLDQLPPVTREPLGGADRGLHYLQGGSSCPNSSWTEPSSDVHSSQATASTAGPATTCPFSPITPLGLSQLCKHRALCPHRSYPHPARTHRSS